MWTLHTDSGNNVYGGQSAKNIYLGETRIVTKLNSGTNPTYQEEYYKQYFYHSDHLGSASLISDYKGEEYQRIEYTPYGETWVEKTQNTGLEFLPYKFTGKEIDEETGLYYYGARYLDPKYSMWLSCDPALGKYISDSSNSTSGGIYNSKNFNLYHYASNNPITYTDPDGNDFKSCAKAFGKGMWDAAVNDVKGIVNTVVHPIQTAKNIYNGVKNELTELVADAPAYFENKVNVVKDGINNFIEASDEERAYIIGGVTEKVVVTAVATKGLSKLKGAEKVGQAANGSERLLLASPRMAKHHIFPQQFKKYFNKSGIDIDKYTVSVPHNTTHLKGIHGKGFNDLPGGWNSEWKNFIMNNPNATQKEILQFGGRLMDKYGLNQLPIVEYYGE